mmetsp:Transcript_35799/g.86595  ORF Transcript_35799/g.86595 Transcript_35799/m.86595 type:complete len:438 (+) Transcript_35799:394-1707(+)
MSQNSGRMKFKAKSKLISVFRLLPQKADRTLFRGKIPESEIQCWLDYVIEGIRGLTTNKSWIQSGHVADAWLLLEPCQFMFCHGVPVVLAFESEFFQVLSSFIKVRKESDGRAMPSTRLCNKIALLVSTAFTFSISGFDNNWSSEKSFKKLDASGILEEFLRCATVPYPTESADWNKHLYTTLYFLQLCTRILLQRFQKGKPCGDTLQAILDGKDGAKSGTSSKVMKRLQAIASASIMRATDAAEHEHGSCLGLAYGCNNCGKLVSKESLMNCAQCNTNYCSKKCQRAEWKVHKSECNQCTKTEFKNRKMIKLSVANVLEKRSDYINLQLTEACHTLGAKRNELILELDFLVNDGIVPAMDDLRELKISSITEYLEGCGEKFSPWVSGMKEKNPDDYARLVATLMAKASFSNRPSEGFGVLARTVGGGLWVEFVAFS